MPVIASEWTKWIDSEDGDDGNERTEDVAGGIVECAACGYAPPGRIPIRCPRCFAYDTFRHVAQAGKYRPALDPAREAARASDHILAGGVLVRRRGGVFIFELRRVAQQVYLMIRPATDGPAKLLPMRRRSGDEDDSDGWNCWRLGLRIAPGEHRIRLFIDDGAHIEGMALPRQMPTIHGGEQKLIVGEGPAAPVVISPATTAEESPYKLDMSALERLRRRRRRRRRRRNVGRNEPAKS
jgi:hypothetical protein